MKISPNTKRAMWWGVATHAVVVGFFVFLTYNKVSREVGPLWFWVFFQWDFLSTLLIVLVERLLPGSLSALFSPELYKAITVGKLFVAGSVQWALIFSGVRKLWDCRKVMQGSRL